MKVSTTLFWIIALVWGGFVLLLTLLPGYTPLVSKLMTAIGGTETAQAFGHIGLFSSLTLVLWSALRTWLASHMALLGAMGTALLIGTTTELTQWYIPYRGATLVDLFANWLGTFMVGFAIAYGLYLRYGGNESARWSSTGH